MRQCAKLVRLTTRTAIPSKNLKIKRLHARDRTGSSTRNDPDAPSVPDQQNLSNCSSLRQFLPQAKQRRILRSAFYWKGQYLTCRHEAEEGTKLIEAVLQAIGNSPLELRQESRDRNQGTAL